MRNEVIRNTGGFCSLFDLKKLKYKDPILLSSTDGVGTKLCVAINFNKLDYLGFDLVAMCVNDILASGGEPLFFLDYISSSRIEKKDFLILVKSINKACKVSNCSLVGGETAEMPGLYKNNDFDIAGFSVGVVERENLLKKENVKKGDLIIGLESNGIHSNGFSMVRKIMEINKISLDEKLSFNSKKKVGDELVKPTKIYVDYILPLIKKRMIKSIAHITGGGIYENLARAIPKELTAIIDFKNYKIPKIFLWLQKLGSIENKEMLKTFNCGIGLILIISENQQKGVISRLNKKGIKFWIMGKTFENKMGNQVIIENYGKWVLK